jgi:hypothetical protein
MSVASASAAHVSSSSAAKAPVNPSSTSPSRRADPRLPIHPSPPSANPSLASPPSPSPSRRVDPTRLPSPMPIHPSPSASPSLASPSRRVDPVFENGSVILALGKSRTHVRPREAELQSVPALPGNTRRPSNYLPKGNHTTRQWIRLIPVPIHLRPVPLFWRLCPVHPRRRDHQLASLRHTTSRRNTKCRRTPRRGRLPNASRRSGSSLKRLLSLHRTPQRRGSKRRLSLHRMTCSVVARPKQSFNVN